jgi:hypothetical protein
MPMALTRADRERITDSRHKVQLVTHILKDVDPRKIPHFEAIEDCLEDADKSLAKALRPSAPDDAPDPSSAPKR